MLSEKEIKYISIISMENDGMRYLVRDVEGMPDIKVLIFLNKINVFNFLKEKGYPDMKRAGKLLMGDIVHFFLQLDNIDILIIYINPSIKPGTAVKESLKESVFNRIVKAHGFSESYIEDLVDRIDSILTIKKDEL